jgi:glycosyltransferase involved in cell wall biosynthesis
MKIILISSRVPAADKNGDQVVSFFRVMYLSKKNSVEIICFGDILKQEDRDAKLVLEAAGIVVHFVKRKLWVSLGNLLLAIPNPKIPFQCALAKSSDFEKTINSVIQNSKPDLLYFVVIRICSNFVKYDGRIFVDLVDSMGLNFFRRASMTKGPLRWLLNLEASRVSAYERRIALKATRSFVVSKIDQNFIATDKVDVIPLGIDMQRFYKTENRAEGSIIAFTGNMFYQPNADAVLWFVQNCWLQVKFMVPGVRLLIVGSNPSHSILTLGKNDNDIIVTGRVPSVAYVLNTSTVAIAPMQSGSGMQFKILEAMACGVPVVTTTLGLGDISALPNQDLLVADSPVHFCNAVVSLLKSKLFAESVGECGMQYVRTHHSWDALNERFAKTCGIS